MVTDEQLSELSKEDNDQNWLESSLKNYYVNIGAYY